MRITKFGHACVRIEHDGVALVVDPGMFTQPEAVDGAARPPRPGCALVDEDLLGGFRSVVASTP